MYIKQLNIQNIRSIENLKMSFEEGNFAGWHVIIGDNGAGKTTLIRALAISLINEESKLTFNYNSKSWRRIGSDRGEIRTTFKETLDKISKISKVKLYFESNVTRILDERISENNEYFSASYGPFRRFSGGRKEHDKTFENDIHLSAHLSCFGEDVALTEIIPWLQKLQFKKLELTAGLADNKKTLVDDIKEFINNNALLPHNTKLESITSDKVTFIDGNNNEISIADLSDGYRSVLSLTLELIRQMVLVFGEGDLFNYTQDGTLTVNQPGVVLIDEIDAHLHPTWQTKIGNWFTKYFPKIQFIVTTHSPLICRASETGTIWKLSAPGAETSFRKLEGIERDRLIVGNVLEAYGTNVFGENISRSEKGSKLLDRMAKLNKKMMMGTITETEKIELTELKQKMPTEK